MYIFAICLNWTLFFWICFICVWNKSMIDMNVRWNTECIMGWLWMSFVFLMPFYSILWDVVGLFWCFYLSVLEGDCEYIEEINGFKVDFRTTGWIIFLQTVHFRPIFLFLFLFVYLLAHNATTSTAIESYYNNYCSLKVSIDLIQIVVVFAPH